MRRYELTIVLAEGATAAKKKQVKEKIVKLIEVSKGKVGKVEDWGKIDTGIFLHFPLELKPETAKILDSKLNLEEDVIRYLLVKVNG
jgi:ribosomal protein S6